MSILVLQSIGEEAKAQLESYGPVVLLDPAARPADIREQAAAAEAILCSANNQIGQEIINAAPALKVISNIAVGYDNIDLASARERNIVVTRTPGTLEQSVAEFCFAHILALSRRLVKADSYVRQGKFTSWSLNLLLGRELRGKKLGIIGFGNIGQALVPIAQGFGMNIVYTNQTGEVKKFQNDSRVVYGELETVLPSADYVVLLVPLSEKTRHLITAKQLVLMKREAFLINMARGGVVSEKDLIQALRAGTIAGAGLDVYEHEPQVSQELLAMPNVVLTPHIGSATMEARRRMIACAVQNIVDVLTSKPCPNQI